MFFLAGRRSSIFGVWAAPAAPKKQFQKAGDEDPHLLELFWGPRGHPDPEHRRFLAYPNNVYDKSKCRDPEFLSFSLVVLRFPSPTTLFSLVFRSISGSVFLRGALHAKTSL